MFIFPIKMDWIIAPSGRNWNGAGVDLDIVRGYGLSVSGSGTL